MYELVYVLPAAAGLVAVIVWIARAAGEEAGSLRREARARGLECDHLGRTLRGTWGRRATSGGYRDAADDPGAIDVTITAETAGATFMDWWSVRAKLHRPLAFSCAIDLAEGDVHDALRSARASRSVREALREIEPELRAAAELGLRSVDERGMHLETLDRDLARLWASLAALHDLATALARVSPRGGEGSTAP